jgi:hypothetical protein
VEQVQEVEITTTRKLISYLSEKTLTEHYLENGRGSRTPEGFIDFDAVVAYNQANTDPYSGDLPFAGQLIGSNGFQDDGVNRSALIRRASMNSHDWVGAISNLEYESGNWKYSVGIDLRNYTGYHYRTSEITLWD